MKRAAIYARYSAGPRQTDQSIEGQLRVCKEFCAANAFEPVEEYIDRHISGKTDQRPDFQRMISDGKKHKFDVVVVYRTDRFSRDRYEAAIYKQQLKKAGIEIRYAMEPIPEGPEGVLMESVMEGLAAYYSLELAQKISRGMRENALKGKATGSVPYGYKIGPEKYYEVDEHNAEAVRMIFQMFNAGASYIEITRWLNQHGYRTAYGKDFNKSSLYRILTNEKYVGIYCYKKTIMENAIPPIVSMAVFSATKAELYRRKHMVKDKSHKSDYLLSGKLYCGMCESLMIGISGTGKQGSRFCYYACPKHRHKQGCEKRNVPKDVLEASIVFAVKEHFRDPGNFEYLLSRLAELTQNDPDREEKINAYKLQIKSLERAIANLTKAIERAEDPDLLLNRLTERTTEKKLVEQEFQAFLEHRDTWTTEELSAMLKLSLAAWEGESDLEFCRRIINTYVYRIYLFDDRAVIIFNIKKDGELAKEEIAMALSSSSSDLVDLCRPWSNIVNPNVLVITCQLSSKSSRIAK